MSAAPLVMGVLNIAEDSFINQSVAHGEYIMRDGASIIDVGSNSTLSVQQELDRVIPVIEALAKRLGIPISVNTSNPDVMLAAVNAGAKMINDELSLTKPGALRMAAKLGVAVCLVHMQSTQSYNDVVKDVYGFLEQRIAACKAEGMDPSKLIIDPGFGLGKNLQQNLSLLTSLQIFKNLQSSLLIDLTNNSMIGQILNVPVEERIYGSIAVEVIAVSKGADIIRATEVKATVDALKIVRAISE